MENFKINELSINSEKKAKTNIQNYYELEKDLIYFINDTLKSELNLIINKLSEKEKSFFNSEVINEIKLSWIFNTNTVHKNRGDVCSSTIQKFYHVLFNDYENDDIKKSELGKFRSFFCDLFQTNLILALNNQSEDNLLVNYVNKYEFKNGFLNIFYKPNGRELLNSLQKDNKKIVKEIEEDSFSVYFNYILKNSFFILLRIFDY